MYNLRPVCSVKQHPKPAPTSAIAAALAESKDLNKDLQTTIDALTCDNVHLRHTIEKLNAKVAAENGALRAQLKH